MSPHIKITKADADYSRQIRERAKFTCEKCGSKPHPKGLHAHHLFTRTIKATRFDPDNGVALCYACHMRAHQYQEDTRAFFAEKMGQARFDALAARAHGRRDRVK